MQVAIVQAWEEDVEGVQRVASESWHATYREIYDREYIAQFLERAYSTEGLRRAIQSDRSVFLVARDGHRVVGFCHAGPGERGHQLYRIYVLPDCWRAGIGERLLATMEAALREQGIREYYCYVHSRNEIGKSFYRKQDFVHAPQHDQADEWCMVKRIPPAA
jgi:ribosomal protein S18 acetylase RimI-like enzyme